MEFDKNEDVKIYSLKTVPADHNEEHLAFLSYKDVIQTAVFYSIHKTPTNTHLYIQKLDSTPNKLKALSAFIIHLIINREIQKHKKLQVHIYAVSSTEYIFKNSHLNNLKPQKSDLELINWWTTTIASILPKEKKYLLIPGSNRNYQGWQHGIGVDEMVKCKDLYLLEDHMITKAMKYLNGENTVGELLNVLEAVELGSLRGILTIFIDRKISITDSIAIGDEKENFVGEVKPDNVEENLVTVAQFKDFFGLFYQYSWDVSASKASSDIDAHFLSLEFKGASVASEFDQFYNTEQSAESTKESVTGTNSVQGLVKKKAEVNSIQSLVKKREVYSIQGLVKKREAVSVQSLVKKKMKKEL
jgi:hypothetical protein